MARRVVLAGAGAVGRALSARLAREHEVVVVDPDGEACRSIGTPRTLAEAPALLTGEPRVHVIRADATSRLVLGALAEGSKRPVLVATSPRDDVNLEAGRLARDLGYEPVLAVLHDPAWGERYTAERILTVDCAALVADHLQRAVRHAGAVVPIGVGLGRGELLEVRLLASSPVLGRPLAAVSPDRWRVAAVFRNDTLVLPTGETVLEVDDRVLLVGNPEEMPAVAEHVRMGSPRFPQPWGQRVATLEPGGPDEALAAEAATLAEAAGVGPVVRGSGQIPPGHRPGVVVVRPPRAGRWSLLGGRRQGDGSLCNRIPVPLLFARESQPYRRILVPVSGSGMTGAGVELAIDLARQHGATVAAVAVDLPRLLTGFDEDARQAEIAPIRRLCDLYGVALDDHHRVGNPVRQILAEIRAHDLVVLTRRHGRSNSWMNPDIALRVARQAPCSVLVLTVAGPT